MKKPAPASSREGYFACPEDRGKQIKFAIPESAIECRRRAEFPSNLSFQICADSMSLFAVDGIIRATDVGVCSNRQIPAVLDEWRTPRHEDFRRRNVWSLFNAFTETLKDGSLSELPKRTEALHGLLDSHVGLAGRFSAN